MKNIYFILKLHHNFFFLFFNIYKLLIYGNIFLKLKINKWLEYIVNI